MGAVARRREQVGTAPELLLLSRSREVGKGFAEDIRIHRQILGADGLNLKAQRWSTKIIWG